ncbi:MAG: TonB-dependent receptor [Thermoanaerobaculia bacterium]|nr:TonB-dependent receptor [Thermoanaerobaculia bacterium]
MLKNACLVSLVAFALFLPSPPAVVAQPAEGEAAEPSGDEPDASASPAAATEEVITVVGDQLEETVPLQLQEYGARVEVVGQQEIQEGRYVDVSQILQSSVPGLYLAQKSGPFDYVNASLQGSRTKDVLWLVDGVRISNRLYDSTTPLDTLPSHQIERVEVLKGGQSLFYGTQSVGGVINVVTRAHASGNDGSVSVGVDSDDGTHVNGQARLGTSTHRFVLYASRDDADGFQPYRDGDYQPSSTDRERSYDVRTFGGRYRTAVGNQVLVSAQVQHADGQVDFAMADKAAVSFNERDEIIGSAKIDWSPSRRFDLYAKAYWHDWDSTYTRFDNDLDNPGELIPIDDHSIWEFSDTGFNLVGEVDVAATTTLLFGYDYQEYDGRDDVFLIGSQTESVDALFTQARFSADLLDGASFAAGVRYNAPSDGQSKTVWNLSGKLAIDRSLYARAQVGTSFRLPTAYELYVTDPCCEKGNPNLVGEESFNAEAGVGGRAGGFYWEALVFQRNIQDLIDIDFDLPEFPDGLIVNTDGEVDVFGFALIGGYDFTKSVSASFSYQYSEAEEDGSTDQIQDVPLDVAQLSVRWHPDGVPLALSAAGRYVGEVYDAVGGGVGRVEHGGYEVVDLAATYTLAGRHHIGARLENVFDEEYSTRIQRARRDVDGSSYGAGTLGLPRTLYVDYRIGF